MVDGGHEHLEWLGLVAGRRRHMPDDRLEQRREIRRRHIEIHRGDTLARRCIDNRRVELGLVRLQLNEQIEHLVMDPQRVGARPIDLVDHDDRRAAQRERLPQHEARLRHRTIECIHHQQHTVDHTQDPFDLAAEIGVARRIHDVDLRAMPPDRRVLGQNRDAPLPLERIGIHDPLFHDLILAERASLAQHLVHQGRFPMVDVRDDGDIPNFHRREI